MDERPRQMAMALILDAFGGHQAAWLAGDRSDCNPTTDINHFVQIARTAEQAKLSAVSTNGTDLRL